MISQILKFSIASLIKTCSLTTAIPSNTTPEISKSCLLIDYCIVRVSDTNFHKKTTYYEDFMKLSGIEGNIMASISEGVPTHPASIFKMAAIKMITDFKVRTLKMIEITDFNDLSVDSYHCRFMPIQKMFQSIKRHITGYSYI